MTDDLQNFMTDLVAILREEAAAAKQKSKGASATSYEGGRLFGLYEALSLIQQQAVAFGLPLERVGMKNFDAEKDVL